MKNLKLSGLLLLLVFASCKKKETVGPAQAPEETICYECTKTTYSGTAEIKLKESKCGFESDVNPWKSEWESDGYTCSKN